MTATPAPIINDTADRALGRIILRHGLATLVVLLVLTLVMAIVNIPNTPLFSYRRFLDTLSILVVLLPFFLGINRLFSARLVLGRTFVQERRWREAAAALDPFAGPTQRFLDTTGEAHYLLGLAYAGMGEKAKAEAIRAFLRRHRPGQWAGKLEHSPGQGQENRPRPSKKPPQRRH